MTNPTVYDVVVVGAGIIGASCAHHLAQQGHKVAVLEAKAGAAEGSTGLSFASVRAQWADGLNTELSWRSIRFYRDFRYRHGIDIGYQPNGYLFLVPEANWERQLHAVELQRAHGVPVEVLDVDRAQKITPFDPAGIGGATWGTADGQIDPHSATNAFLALARGKGADVFFKAPVDAIDKAGELWTVSAGDRAVTARHVINAAGGWAGEVAGLAGLDVPVVHSRRNVYATAEGALDSYVPMTVDLATGVYMRSEGRRLLFAGAKPTEVDGYNTAIDWPWMEELLALAADRFPWLVELPLDRRACWAGTYENTPDHDGIVGADPREPQWINACGFSGHGLIQAPEIGRLVTEQVTTGAITSIDLSELSLARFQTGAIENSVSLVF
ncbi:NAD(P)/FAD-dependent oxidoreductase [Rhodococcus koreensis]|uniref:NAD(P)/FAD-dependent oxidoreductase n=1 Tax=Rhodococcus koreensis TaxID=99653 RepID=UPI00367007DF